MDTQELKKKYPDLVVSKSEFPVVYSASDLMSKLKEAYGINAINRIIHMEHSGRNVTLYLSVEYGSFISQLAPGSSVIMTGADIEFNPEWKDKVWEISYGPAMMCGEWVVWLKDFSGAYSCQYLKLEL